MWVLVSTLSMKNLVIIKIVLVLVILRKHTGGAIQSLDAIEYDDKDKTCVCDHKDLIAALDNCLDSFKTQENDQNQNKEMDNVMLQLSCSCSGKVYSAITKSLKSCTKAVKYNKMCSSTPVHRKNYTSCVAIKKDSPNSKSGNYDLVINNKSMRVYCNMDTLCRSSEGWIKLGSLNMTNETSTCPKGLKEYTVSGVRMCGWSPSGGRCTPIIIPSNNFSYSWVCARVKGYQGYTTGGFHNFINSAYFDGISITHRSPRKHIWSLASGYIEIHTNSWACPCNKGASDDAKPPAFVSDHYYCKSATTPEPKDCFYPEDPLWDGKLCRGREELCCLLGSLRPWFDRDIGTATTDNIEVRLCADKATDNENIAIGQYEFYVM